MDNKQILQINLESCIKEFIEVLKNCQNRKDFKILDEHIQLFETVKLMKEDLIKMESVVKQ